MAGRPEGVVTPGFVSADAHVNEPRDLWSANLPRDLHEVAMRGITAGDDGAWRVLFDSSSIDMTSRSRQTGCVTRIPPTGSASMQETA